MPAVDSDTAVGINAVADCHFVTGHHAAGGNDMPTVDSDTAGGTDAVAEWHFATGYRTAGSDDLCVVCDGDASNRTLLLRTYTGNYANSHDSTAFRYRRAAFRYRRPGGCGYLRVACDGDVAGRTFRLAYDIDAVAGCPFATGCRSTGGGDTAAFDGDVTIDDYDAFACYLCAVTGCCDRAAGGGDTAAGYLNTGIGTDARTDSF